MNYYQNTLKKAVSLSGSGLHTGKEATVTFHPAPPNFGYKFQRIDIPEQPIIKADADLVTEVQRGTTLEYKGAKVSTIEHALAALVGLAIDNVLITIDSQEMPIMDGSSRPFVDALLEAGIEQQNEKKNYFVVNEPFYYYDEERDTEIIALPADEYQVTVMIDFNSPVLGKQHASIAHIDEFAAEIASSRTFCFLHELELLLQHNLIKGGDLNNAIVVVDKTIAQEELNRLATLFGKETVEVRSEGYLNNLELRHQNEPARHKLLDVLGDLALIGTPIKARIIATKPGHISNVAFAQKLKAHIKKHKHLLDIPKYDNSKPSLYDINQIKKYIPHRFPFLLVDKIVEMSDKHVVGIKNVTANEEFFQGHFPGHPIMPGVLIIEAMAQTGGILMLNTTENPQDYVTYFLMIDKAKFRNPVVPGDTLIFKLELASPIRRGLCEMNAVAYVNNKIAAEAFLTAQILKKQ